MRIPTKVIQETLTELEKTEAAKRVAPLDLDEEDTKTFAKKSITPNFMSRRSYRTEETQGALVEAGRKSIKQINDDIKTINRLTKNMSSSDKETFNTLYVMGQKYKVWHNSDRMDEWGVNKTVQDAFNQFHIDSDKNYLSANALDRKIKAAQKWQSNSLGDTVKHFNKSQLSSKQFSQMSIFDPESNRILSYRNSSVDSIKENYLDKGYEIYTMHPDEVIGRNLDYTHYLAKNENLSDLKPFTLPYVAGGSRAYTPYTHFVKVGRDFYGDGGILFHGFPKTLKAGEEVKRLETYANEVNQVSELWNKTQGDLAMIQEGLDKMNLQEFKINSAEDVKALMRSADNPKGIIDPNYEAKVLRGDEKYVYNDSFGNIENSEEYDQAMSNLMEIRGQYYRGKGDEILENLNNDYGHVVDPFTMWQRNVEQAAQNNTLGQIMVDFGEYFKKTYAPVIDNQNGRFNINRMSGAEVIAAAQIKAPNSSFDDLARAATRAQATYKNILNIPTTLDTKINKFFTGLFHTLPKRFWDNRFVDSILKSNPVDYANAVVFRNYLGCFNIKQFILQGPAQMVNNLAIHPVRGLQALVSIPAVLLGHFFKNTPVVKYIPKLLAGMGGISQKEYEGFLEYIENYGTFKQFSQRPELAAKMENWLRIPGGVKNIDLIFAQAGNNLSQLHADLTAFLIDGGKNMRRIAQLSDDMMLNLNRVNTSTLQRTSIGRLAAQFTSYPMAAYEIMTGTHLSGWQRARFMAAQIGMWGIGGTFAKDYVTNMYNFVEENFPNIDVSEIAWTIDGLLTQWFAEQGVYVNEGTDLLGTLNQVSTIIPVMQSIFGGAPELPVSNVPTIVVDNYNMAKDLICPDTNTFDLLHWAKDVNKKRGVASGIKHITQFYYAYDTKKFLDRHGEALKEDMNTFQTFAALLGFAPIERELNYRQYLTEKNEREAVLGAFEERVLPSIEKYVTFRDTGEGKTELVHNRDEAWMTLYGELKTNVREFHAYVREFHPELSNYATNLVQKAYQAGHNLKYKRTKVQQNIYEQEQKRLGLQE